MRRVTISAIRGALLLVSATSCASASPLPLKTIATEFAERKAIGESVRAAVEGNDYALLDALALRYRTSDPLTSSGASKLLIFHANAEYYLQPRLTPGSCTFDPSGFDRWDKASPQSPSAPIVRAAALIRQAWCLRGNGPAATVDPASWPKVHASVEAAATTLRRNAALASQDPEYYSVMLRIYVLQGRDRAAFDRLLADALASAPSYYGTYFEAYEYVRPQWFGGVADIDVLARKAATHTQDREGQGGYARVYWHVSKCNCRANMAAMDWPKMKAAMADVMQRFPSEWNAANFARIACRQGDVATAAKYLGMTRSDDAAAWTDQIERDQCKAIVAFAAQSGR